MKVSQVRVVKCKFLRQGTLSFRKLQVNTCNVIIIKVPYGVDVTVGVPSRGQTLR